MKAHEVDPNVDSRALLAGAQFIDAYSIVIDDAALDARRAAEKMLARAPRWIEALLALRNYLVTPFGLKTSTSNEASASEIIGIFPIVSQSPDRLVAGFDDHHLDFRVVVDVAACGPCGGPARHRRPRWCSTHNLLGPSLFGDHPAVSPARGPRRAAASCRGVKRRYKPCDSALILRAGGRRRWRLRPLPDAALEVLQILAHLLQRKSQREKPLRHIAGQAARQTFAA